jgi:hypothetical protein
LERKSKLDHLRVRVEEGRLQSIPLPPADEGLAAGGPIRIIDNEVPGAERKLSTISKSAPLHTVQVAREISRQLGSMELFHVLCEIQNQLAAAESLPSLLDIIVGLV